MTAMKAMEYRITQRVLARRGRSYDDAFELPLEDSLDEPIARRWPGRLIQVLALTALLVVGGSLLQELLWAGLAAATAAALAAD